MSAVADMYFVNGGTRRQGGRAERSSSTTSACSMADPESGGPNLSEDDTRSCNSEQGSEVCNLRIRPTHGQNLRNEMPEDKGGRRNKRKNFMPRNIVEYAGSDEEDDHGQGQRLFINHPQLQSPPDSGSIPSPNLAGESDDEEEDGRDDAPLDLSEVQNNSKHLWRKPDFMNASSLSFPGASFLHSSGPELMTSPNPPQIIVPHPPAHSFLPFVPMDLRLSALAGLTDPEGMDPRSGPTDQDMETDSDDGLDEFDEGSNVNNSMDSSPHQESSLNGHHHHHHRSLLHKSSPSRVTGVPHLTSNSASLLSDFAESTMKELIGLYGIAENLRQAGGKGNSTDIPSLHRHLNNSTSSEPASPPGHHHQPNKMMLPENMARLLAAMQESVTASNSNNASGSRGQNNPSSPLSNSSSSGPQGSAGLASYKSHINLNNNNQGEGNNINENTNSSSGFAQQKVGHKGGRGKGPSSTGRGLTSFPVIREGLLGKGTGPVDYTRYVRRFSSFSECGQSHCRELNYREHFHCHECSHGTRVFVKKEEMIRHFKWHKKRDESLQHGFMRYSPSDDCSDRFAHCPHNRKQTHYHCLQDSCEKVYISTSDVQMHANYHRKDSAIIQEGFQRFRAAEDCGTDHCSFRHQRTTHFHCRRSTCSYTFKNKADMEKHKSYHVKDEQLNRDGFKKFMKHETCPYTNCRFSGICNHIHCIRNGCSYVLHSSGQLYSHKRKHDRRDSELAYRKFKLAQSVMRGALGVDFPAISDSFIGAKFEDENSHHSSVPDAGTEPETEETVKKFIQPCKCEVTPEDHFHCRSESCVNALLGTAEVASEHSRSHELENRISSLAYFTVDPANFDAQDSTIPCVSSKCIYQETELQRKHHHCLWDGCSAVILETDEPFRRLDHFREHERTQKLEIVVPPTVPITVEKTHNDSMDGFFRRKRGRPPKNRVIEGGSTDAIFTSFKLPKPRILGEPDDITDEVDMKDPIGFLSFPEGSTCTDNACAFNMSNTTGHYHCGHPRCYFSVSDVHKLSLHLRDFHTNVDILEGFEYFDRSHADCRQPKCEFKNSVSHFHCVRDGFTFSRYSNMSAHESECHESKSTNGMSSDEDDKPWYGHSQRTRTKSENASHNPMDLSNSNGEGGESKHVTDHSLSRILQLPVDSSETLFGPQSACGRPFCKLKRKSHYHCHMCNQAFSDLVKLRPHVLKHNAPTPQKSVHESDDAESETSFRNDDDEKTGTKIKKEEPMSYPSSHASSPAVLDTSATISPNPSTSYPPTSLSSFLAYPVSHSPYLLYQQNPLSSIYQSMMFGGGGATPFPAPPPPVLTPPSPTLGPGPLSPPNLPTTSTKRPSSGGSSPSSPTDSKKQRLQLRILKDEPVPEGYVRFRFNEDCAFLHCGYREHQTHFHCTREDCGYSFCDKTRFVQHTARHERLDTLMGGDFKQYRANVSCGRPACTYVPTTGTPSPGSAAGQNKASHFHCSKCDFVCTDTNKVVAHRRAHQKLDSINAAGFEKYTPSQNCHIDGCAHAQKQTHYHCLKCSYAVVGLSQMSAHKYRHTD